MLWEFLVFMFVGFVAVFIVSIIEARKHPVDAGIEKEKFKKQLNAEIRRNRWYNNNPF